MKNRGLLDISGLKTYFATHHGMVKAVDEVDLWIKEGEALGIAGESGCGKSTLALSIIRLVQDPGRVVGGQILFEGTDLLRLTEKQMRKIRGDKISMIFQNPMSSLNPVFQIGDQIAEAIELHRRDARRALNRLRSKRKKEIAEEVSKILAKVGISDPSTRMNQYPHQFSGGMRQRVMIAIAVACSARLIIADEPTTSLDVTVQAQVLRLLSRLRSEFRSSMLLISHDLGVLSQVCDRVAVMYAGKIVEQASPAILIGSPKHPYTKALVNCIPRLGVERLSCILGAPPDLTHPPKGCRFHPRCNQRLFGLCDAREPRPVRVRSGNVVSCFLYGRNEN